MALLKASIGLLIILNNRGLAMGTVPFKVQPANLGSGHLLPSCQSPLATQSQSIIPPYEGEGLGSLIAYEWNRQLCNEDQVNVTRNFGECINGPFPSYDGGESPIFSQFTANEFNIIGDHDIDAFTVYGFPDKECRFGNGAIPRWSVKAVRTDGEWIVPCTFQNAAQSYVIIADVTNNSNIR